MTRWPKIDHRDWSACIRDAFVVWAFIIGLSVELLVWCLVAWITIGNRTIHEFKYYVPNPTPAAYPYNQIERARGQDSR